MPPIPSPLTVSSISSRCSPSIPIPGCATTPSAWLSLTPPPYRKERGSWTWRTRILPPSPPPAPETAMRASSKFCTLLLRCPVRAAASSCPLPPMSTNTLCSTLFARNRTNTASSRIICATPTPPLPCACPHTATMGMILMWSYLTPA